MSRPDTDTAAVQAVQREPRDDAVGFIGTGVMGTPMALSLLRAGTSLVLWNRTRARTTPLAQAGARVVDAPAEVFAEAQTVVMMLATGDVIDSVLGRGTPVFDAMVHGRTVISMATTPPDYSRSLAADLHAAGARYVEAPVAGSRPAAESRQLVSMIAGEREVVSEVTPLVRLMCRTAVSCGPVPSALLMKLAVNLVSGALMTVLAEGITYARSQGLDADQFAAVLEASPLASDYLRAKAAKMITRDFSVQGALGVARKDLTMIEESASRAGASTPLIKVCREIWDEAIALGLADEDMAAVQRAYEVRVERTRQGHVAEGLP